MTRETAENLYSYLSCNNYEDMETTLIYNNKLPGSDVGSTSLQFQSIEKFIDSMFIIDPDRIKFNNFIFTGITILSTGEVILT